MLNCFQGDIEIPLVGRGIILGYFHFDPRDMITGPYITCPKCNGETFGILSIYDNSYTRRCRSCLYPKGNERSVSSALPKINKKVIYLDQFVISNMMKVLNPKTKANKKGIDNFWLRLFERLDSLSKLQLVVCPDSEYHDNESQVTAFYKELKRMYELLSHGKTFYDKETIKNFQLHEHFTNWLVGKNSNALDLDIDEIVHGSIDSWTSRLIISVNREINMEAIEALLEHRNQSYSAIEGVFRLWSESKNTDFNYWYKNEVEAFGKGTLNMYFKHQLKLYEVWNNPELDDFEDYEALLPSSSVRHVNMMLKVLGEHGVEDELLKLSKIVEYFKTANFDKLPFLHLSASLFASIARKAAAGRKKPPNRGTVNDIEMISTFLPYCDAMFIDNECASYLNEKPLVDKIGFPTKIFSQSKREEFMQFLDEIEQSASQEHIELVTKVYGESWKTPYVTLYKPTK